MVLSRVFERQSDPTNGEGNPVFPSKRSKKMISDSVELWETEGCFLHFEFLGTNVRFPERHNVPPEVDINLRKMGVLKQSQPAIVSQ